MIRLEKAQWASLSFMISPEHMELIRRFASLHTLSPRCFQLVMDPVTYGLREQHGNSALHWSRVFEWPWALLSADLSPDHEVLDIGGSYAVFQYAAAMKCKQLINLDPDKKALESAQEMAQRMQITNIETVVGDATDLSMYPGDSGYFDRVFCVSVMEHIPDWRKCLSELFRVLKPGGKLILTMDIKMAGPTGAEFNIMMNDVAWLFSEHGHTPPFLPDYTSVNQMPDGTELACLCMVFHKES